MAFGVLGFRGFAILGSGVSTGGGLRVQILGLRALGFLGFAH